MLVAEVEPKSPAALAGVEAGMLIAAIGRYDVTDIRLIEKLLAQIDSGNRVDFGLVWWNKNARGKKLVSDTVRVVAR